MAIYGEAKASTDATPTHKETIDRVSRELAESGDYAYVCRERAWHTATDGISSERRLKPDIIAVGNDGKVYAWEVKSKTDLISDLEVRLGKGMDSLPLELRTNPRVILADAPKGGS